MMNNFENDDAYVSTRWLLQLITGRGLVIEHVLRIVHTATEKSHHIANLQSYKINDTSATAAWDLTLAFHVVIISGLGQM